MKYLNDLNLVTSKNLPHAGTDSTVKNILTDAFVILGALAVLMIVIAGLRYIFARGNPDATAQAKNMIQHSLVGLILAALAAVIVNVVLNKAG
ncbi:MAG TPA: pilin [Candidatus Saccharimonadales bacterium]|nr:pilin [Candidatus Saccharimonadales bacterium]